MDAEADSLLQLIQTAFHNVPRGPLSMHQAHIAKWADEDQLTLAGAQDGDTRWTEISDATIEEARNALYGADAISWRYFLPAYLRWTIRHFRTNASFICDQTIYAFTIHNVGEPLPQDSVLRFRYIVVATEAHRVRVSSLHGLFPAGVRCRRRVAIIGGVLGTILSRANGIKALRLTRRANRRFGVFLLTLIRRLSADNGAMAFDGWEIYANGVKYLSPGLFALANYPGSRAMKANLR
jgi:hypothetical protein